MSGPTVVTRSIWRAVLALVALSFMQLQLAAPSEADHIKGATYNGNHSGGGTISFTVTGDGAGISSVSATNIPGDFCTFESSSTEYVNPLAITDHAFSDTSPPLMFSGTFPSPQSAQGTLRASSTFPPCDTGDVSWTATTTSLPDTSGDECEKAKQAVKKAKAKLKKAEGKRAKERARKKLNRAKARKRAAC